MRRWMWWVLFVRVTISEACFWYVAIHVWR